MLQAQRNCNDWFASWCALKARAVEREVAHIHPGFGFVTPHANGTSAAGPIHCQLGKCKLWQSVSSSGLQGIPLKPLVVDLLCELQDFFHDALVKFIVMVGWSGNHPFLLLLLLFEIVFLDLLRWLLWWCLHLRRGLAACFFFRGWSISVSGISSFSGFFCLVDLAGLLEEGTGASQTWSPTRRTFSWMTRGLFFSVSMVLSSLSSSAFFHSPSSSTHLSYSSHTSASVSCGTSGSFPCPWPRPPRPPRPRPRPRPLSFFGFAASWSRRVTPWRDRSNLVVTLANWNHFVIETSLGVTWQNTAGYFGHWRTFSAWSARARRSATSASPEAGTDLGTLGTWNFARRVSGSSTCWTFRGETSGMGSDVTSMGCVSTVSTLHGPNQQAKSKPKHGQVSSVWYEFFEYKII